MSKKVKSWYGQFGVLLPEHDAVFDELVEAIRPAIAKLEGEVSYTELYNIAKEAASAAVGNLVRDFVNKRDFELLHKSKTKPKKKPVR